LGWFQSIIDPPSEKTGDHGKGRGNGPKDEKVEAGDLKGRVFKDKIEENESFVFQLGW
jgi:hypothetical protein